MTTHRIKPIRETILETMLEVDEKLLAEGFRLQPNETEQIALQRVEGLAARVHLTRNLLHRDRPVDKPDRSAFGTEPFEGPTAMEIETFPDDHIAVWAWLHAPEWARELFRHERRFILFIPCTFPDDAVSLLGLPDRLGDMDRALHAEQGDGSKLVAFG